MHIETQPFASSSRDDGAGAKAYAGMKTRKPARWPSIGLIVGSFVVPVGAPLLQGMVPESLGGNDVITIVFASAATLMFLGGLFGLIYSFVQLGVPRGHEEAFKLAIKRAGRHPTVEAARFAVGAAVIAGVSLAVILGINALANGAGIPLMVIWAFGGTALGLAAAANLVRSFFVSGEYRRRVLRFFDP